MFWTATTLFTILAPPLPTCIPPPPPHTHTLCPIHSHSQPYPFTSLPDLSHSLPHPLILLLSLSHSVQAFQFHICGLGLLRFHPQLFTRGPGLSHSAQAFHTYGPTPSGHCPTCFHPQLFTCGPGLSHSTQAFHTQCIQPFTLTAPPLLVTVPPVYTQVKPFTLSALSLSHLRPYPFRSLSHLCLLSSSLSRSVR